MPAPEAAPIIPVCCYVTLCTAMLCAAACGRSDHASEAASAGSKSNPATISSAVPQQHSSGTVEMTDPGFKLKPAKAASEAGSERLLR